jgi:hypothetical protein
MGAGVSASSDQSVAVPTLEKPPVELSSPAIGLGHYWCLARTASQRLSHFFIGDLNKVNRPA